MVRRDGSSAGFFSVGIHLTEMVAPCSRLSIISLQAALAAGVLERPFEGEGKGGVVGAQHVVGAWGAAH